MFFNNSNRSRSTLDEHKGDTQAAQAPKQIAASLESNIAYIVQMLGDSPDIVIRRFEIGADKRQVAAIYTDGITDKQTVSQFILQSLMSDDSFDPAPGQSLLDYVLARTLAISEICAKSDWDGILLALLSGDTIIFIEGCTDALCGDTKGGEQRAVTEPSTQVVVRGPKEAFTESIGTNVALVRRKIKSPNIRLEAYKIGSITQTNVAIMYLEGKADPSCVKTIRDRIHRLSVETLEGSEHLEELLSDQRKTAFPTIMNTERPDMVTRNLLDGRITIFIDGTPFTLIAPFTFFKGLISAEDYYQRPESAFAVQALRYAALIIALFGPSIYIAAITFHQEMIPTPLLLSLASQRESVPFPAFLEAFLMEVTFEVIREAGIRMPRAIGQAVSIVGALVLGQAAVEAGIISSAMVIVVALTGISSFANPSYNLATTIRIIRFTMMVAAAIFGFYGIAIFSIFLIGHMCGLQSLGIPYMSIRYPYVPEEERYTLYGLRLGAGGTHAQGQAAPQSSEAPGKTTDGSDP
ncbi:spore germination protein KA [Paenibacillus phyllosphaerae]|uniref:Spore germination protein KA n=1 Tax=Paenibacillus phyllosphaerae TaxID=274593 RepID=A0A7W5FPW1_9BACL|nr:spore germination protein [Paenibacillus phyllosphaerae]MBB3112795.1 spore germination protein KA [Paenibacillus phyllosphaerae]